MAKFNIGDLVVLKSGSMRMCVEDLGEEDAVHTVWCNEGVIGRDVNIVLDLEIEDIRPVFLCKAKQSQRLTDAFKH